MSVPPLPAQPFPSRSLRRRRMRLRHRERHPHTHPLNHPPTRLSDTITRSRAPLLCSHALGAREMLDIQGQGLGCGQICRIGFDPSRSES
jgi:hypothetical protein